MDPTLVIAQRTECSIALPWQRHPATQVPGHLFVEWATRS